MKLFRVGLLLTACVFGQPARVVLVGDSTVNDEGGWGTGLRAALPDLEVINLAQNGRSSKSFRAEGWWQKALDAKPAWVVIQFGNNDGPGKGPDRETDASGSFRQNLGRYVDEARAIGAKPVLVTSIVRRTSPRMERSSRIRSCPMWRLRGWRLVRRTSL